MSLKICAYFHFICINIQCYLSAYIRQGGHWHLDKQFSHGIEVSMKGMSKINDNLFETKHNKR